MEPPSSQSLVVWKYANLRIDRKQEKVVQIPLASLSLYIHQHIGNLNHGTLGNIIWDGSYVLCKFLESRYLRCEQGQMDYLLRNKTVLELGAGTGMVSLTSWILGAHTIATDLPEILPILQFNLEFNRKQLLENLAESFHHRVGLEWRELVWANKKHYEEFLSQKRVDLILAADVIAGIYPLNDLLETLVDLTDEHAHVYIAYKERFPVEERKFFHKANRYFQISKIDRKELPEDFRQSDIDILWFTKRNQINQ